MVDLEDLRESALPQPITFAYLLPRKWPSCSLTVSLTGATSLFRRGWRRSLTITLPTVLTDGHTDTHLSS